MFFRTPSDRRHTAHSRTLRVTIHYPHHPRTGEQIDVLCRRKHQGVVGFVIEQPDGTRTTLPEWMTLPSASTLRCCEWPLLPVEDLWNLHQLLQCAIASRDESISSEEAHDLSTTNSTGSSRPRNGTGDTYTTGRTGRGTQPSQPAADRATKGTSGCRSSKRGQR